MNDYMKMIGHNRIIFTACPEINPIKKLKVIANELIQKKFKGTVVFDLLVFNGNEINRFVIMNFDGLKFDKSNIEYYSHIDPVLEIQQNQFFIENKELLEKSILSSKEVLNFLA